MVWAGMNTGWNLKTWTRWLLASPPALVKVPLDAGKQSSAEWGSNAREVSFLVSEM